MRAFLLCCAGLVVVVLCACFMLNYRSACLDAANGQPLRVAAIRVPTDSDLAPKPLPSPDTAILRELRDGKGNTLPALSFTLRYNPQTKRWESDVCPDTKSFLRPDESPPAKMILIPTPTTVSPK